MTQTDIIGAIRDVQGDKTGGLARPVLYGIRHTLFISVILSFLYLVLTAWLITVYALVVYQLYFSILFSAGILILCVMYLILFTSTQTLTRKQSLSAHELFVAERIILHPPSLLEYQQTMCFHFPYVSSLLLSPFFPNTSSENDMN